MSLKHKTGRELVDGDRVWIQGHVFTVRNPTIEIVQGKEAVRFTGETHDADLFRTGYNGGRYGQLADMSYTLVNEGDTLPPQAAPVVIGGHALIITTRSDGFNPALRFTCENNYGEPKVRTLCFPTAQAAFDNEVAQLEAMLAEDEPAQPRRRDVPVLRATGRAGVVVLEERT